MKVYCVFSLESPYRGDFNEYTQHIIINKKSSEIIRNTTMSAAMLLVVLWTQERLQNSRGTRALIIRATEVLLYSFQLPYFCFHRLFHQTHVSNNMNMQTWLTYYSRQVMLSTRISVHLNIFKVGIQWLEHQWFVYHGCFELVLESLEKNLIAADL